MTSIDAYYALIGGGATWEDYRSNQQGVIDLKLAELQGTNLAGKDLSSCDFSGADLENANLDRCKIYGSDFRSAFLGGASIVFCSISSSVFSNANMRQVVVRESNLENIYFSGTELRAAVFYNCRLQNCMFDKSDVRSAMLELTSLNDCKFSNINSCNVSILGCDFFTSIVNDTTFDCSEIKNSRFLHCSMKDFKLLSSVFDAVDWLEGNILRFDLSSTHASNMNLSGTTLREVNLSQFDISKSVLLDSAINNCIWPRQKGETSIWGIYKTSPDLLGQPVQDVKGLSPTLRREIADAQYIAALTKNSDGISKILLRIWGATTNYGQSLARLATWSLLAILILSLVFVVSSDNIEIWLSNVENSINAIGYITSSFVGFEINTTLVLSRRQEFVLFVTRVFGFFILGLWIGLAANQIGKLSSE